MNVLAINCGSSTLKFDLLAASEVQPDAPGERLVHGIVDGIGAGGSTRFEAQGRPPYDKPSAFTDHGAAALGLLDLLGSDEFLGAGGVDAVGHRVVHGGDRFMEPVLIDDEVIRAIEELTKLAPLHNRPALRAIAATRTVVGTRVPMVATFDTAFHRTLPEYASRYAIPLELADKHHIRRYGFHGLAHRFMTAQYPLVSGRPIEGSRLVTLQLGNGCSGAAIDSGRSIETSMGFTPLEGLMMGTRSGDVDPSLAGFLAMSEEISIAQAESLLNTKSGLLGVSGQAGDMRTLLKAESEGDGRATLAIEMFCHRIRKCMGAYFAILGGADAILFGGGIGENATAIRERICRGMEWCGLTLDVTQNAAAKGIRASISASTSTVSAYVIPVDEAVVIAADTARCVAAETVRLAGQSKA